MHSHEIRRLFWTVTLLSKYIIAACHRYTVEFRKIFMLAGYFPFNAGSQIFLSLTLIGLK